MGCCRGSCADCCLVYDEFERNSLETLTFSSQSGSGEDCVVTMTSDPSYCAAGDTLGGTSMMDDYKYYYYVESVDGDEVTLKFLYSEGDWESSSLDPDPETQGISSFTVRRLGSAYYTNTTEPNYLYGVTDDDFLVTRAGNTSTLFLTDIDGESSFWLSLQASGKGDSSSYDYLRIRTFSTANASAYNESRLRFDDCSECQADYQLISTASSPATDVCPPDITEQGILPASDGLVFGQLAEEDGLVTLEYCTKQQYADTSDDPALSTTRNSFVCLAGPGKANVMQNGTAYGSGESGYGDKHGLCFENTVKVKKVHLEFTDQNHDPTDPNAECKQCITWQCGDATEIAWLDSANRDDTGLLVIDGSGTTWDGTTLTVAGGNTVEIGSQMGIRSMCDPDGTMNNNYSLSPIRIGFAFDINVTGTEGASVEHGWTLVFGNSTDGDGGSINGEDHPVKAGETYHMRYCNTFQVDLSNKPRATTSFVETGFVSGPGVTY